MLNIVCVEDEEDDVELIRLAFERADLKARLQRVSDEAGLLRSLSGPPDLVLCDYNVPGFSPEGALALLERCSAQLPLIVVTRAIGEDAVVELFRAGAKDYVAKDKLALLPSVVLRVLARRTQERAQRRTAEQLAETYARLRQLSARLVDGQERERAVIARDLHDGLGQLLTGLMIRLHAANRSDDREQARALCQQALAMADDALQQVKTLSFDLLPAQLGLLGFAPAVKAMIERKFEGTDVMAELRVRGSDTLPEHPSRAVALRVLQQGLVNVLRHAQARHVVVRVRFGPGDGLVVTVADDGRGFDVAATLQRPVDARNIGLYGMLERAELAGGELRIRSRPGAGTLLRLALGGT
jgi:signal transduction histidine kinase